MVLARSVSRIPTRFEALYNREQARWKTIEAEITDLIPLFGGNVSNSRWKHFVTYNMFPVSHGTTTSPIEPSTVPLLRSRGWW